MESSSLCARSRRACTADRPRRAASAIVASSSATSGTMRFAASVGVDARKSATRSRIGLSPSCPIAETTGFFAFATARTSLSSEKGSRSSTLPPPRAKTTTSTPGASSSDSNASIIASTAPSPCTLTSRTSNRAAGQRPRTLTRTSSRALVLRPHMSPIFPGRKGTFVLRSAENRPSAASRDFNCSILARMSPSPTGRTSSAHSERLPLTS